LRLPVREGVQRTVPLDTVVLSGIRHCLAARV
jgi:hypothetical protein